MTTQFWLESENTGIRENLPNVSSASEAIELAKRIYPNDDSDPESWLVQREAENGLDYFLVPGGPGGEDFTWMPRDMFQEGGPFGQFFE